MISHTMSFESYDTEVDYLTKYLIMIHVMLLMVLCNSVWTGDPLVPKDWTRQECPVHAEERC